MSNKPLISERILGKTLPLKFIVMALMLAGCSQPTTIVDYPPLDWAINGERLKDVSCAEDLQASCPELVALGCDVITAPRFYSGGLQPEYPIMECIHENGEPPNPEYFRQLSGLDPHYRTYVLDQDGQFRLMIKRSEFKAVFAPVESTDEAISYAMAMTSLQARFDLDPNADIDYLVDTIEETHAVETPDGYLVYLFDWSHKMGCDTHPFYAVQVLVTQQGDVHEIDRQEIYKSYACFDFEALKLDEN